MSKPYQRVISSAISLVLVSNTFVPTLAMAKAFEPVKIPPKPIPALPKSTAKPTFKSVTIDPTVRPSTPVATPVARPTSGKWASLLDSQGAFRVPFTEKQRKTWALEIQEGVKPEREARLQIQVGEFYLGNHHPVEALARFTRAESLLPAAHADKGLAAYDRALALYFQGDFKASHAQFKSLLASGLSGYDRKVAQLYSVHAATREGEKAHRKSLGIPEHPRINPLSGVESMGVCVKQLGIQNVDPKSAVRYDGEGSTGKDLLDSCSKLGLFGRFVVPTDKKGLIAVSKPIVARVEKDRFVTIKKADANGITYQDGAEVHLTWKQWEQLQADKFLAVAKAGSAEALALSCLPASPVKESPKIGLAVLGSQNLGIVVAAQRNLNAMAVHVVGTGFPAIATLQLPGLRETAVQPTFQNLAVDADVNLATGEEIHSPAPDITVYNPKGPGFSFQRSYHSLSNVTPTGMGSGWTHNYNYRIQVAGTTTATETIGTIILPNGGEIPFTVPSTTPTAANPEVNVPLPAGVPMQLRLTYNDILPAYPYYTIVFPDRTKWKFNSLLASDSFVLGGTTYYRAFSMPGDIVDKFGNIVTCVWNAASSSKDNDSKTGLPGLFRLYLVYANSTPTVSLRFLYDSNGRLTSVYEQPASQSDLEKRCVQYQVQAIPNDSGYTPAYTDELSYVSDIASATLNSSSQIVEAPAGTAEYYGYTYLSNGRTGEKVPFLTQINFRNPGSRNSATGVWPDSAITNYVSESIAYDSNGGVASRTDVDGNVTLIQPQVSGTSLVSTKVTTQDPGGTIASCYYSYSDANMSATKKVFVTAYSGSTETAWATPEIRSYTSGNPFQPSSITTQYSATQTYTTNYTWDNYGHMLTMTTPKGKVTTNTYLASPNNFYDDSLQSTQVAGKTATSYAYYSNGSLQYTYTPIPGHSNDGLTQTTAIAYSSIGNPLTVVSPGNNSISTHTKTVNYTTGGVELYARPASITDELGHSTQYVYDSRGNVTQVTTADGDVTNYTYDLANKVTRITYPVTAFPSGRRSRVFVYMWLNGPLSKTVDYDESGSPVRTDDKLYGPDGNLRTQTGVSEYANFYYDALQRLIQLQPANAWSTKATQYTYNLLGQIATVRYPNTTSLTGVDTVNFTYDWVGNVTSRTDGLGRVTNYTYGDTDGLLSAVSYPANSSKNIAYYYDDFDRLTLTTDGVGAEYRGYDDCDFLYSKTRYFTGISTGQVVQYNRYPDGSLAILTTPSGTFSHFYDSAGRYQEMDFNNGSGVVAATAQYSSGGKQTRRGLPTGSYSTYQYQGTGNVQGQLTAMHNIRGDGYDWADYDTMTYDGVGNLTSVHTNVAGLGSHTGTTTYGYNSTTKTVLTSETTTRTAGFNNTFAYDSGRNPTTFRGTAGATFNADDQRVGGTYDGNGNQTVINGSTCTYDEENRMTSFGSLLTNGYAANGERAWKQGATGGKTYFLYDGNNPVCELDSTGAVIATNVYAPDGLVARKQNGAWIYYNFDQQGSVTAPFDLNANIYTFRLYDSYGKESWLPGSQSTQQTDPFGFNARWGGYYLDRETGLYLCGTRYYDPNQGRWTSRDPISYQGGINVYAYCGGNPVGRSDPSGKYVIVALALVGLIAVYVLPDIIKDIHEERAKEKRARAKARANRKHALEDNQFGGSRVPSPNQFMRNSNRPPGLRWDVLKDGAKGRSPSHIQYGPEGSPRLNADGTWSELKGGAVPNWPKTVWKFLEKYDWSPKGYNPPSPNDGGAEGSGLEGTGLEGTDLEGTGIDGSGIEGGGFEAGL